MPLRTRSYRGATLGLLRNGGSSSLRSPASLQLTASLDRALKAV